MKAAVDPGFRCRLLSERSMAARSIGITLTSTEQSILAGIPESSLGTMIASFDVDWKQKNRLSGQKSLAAAATLGIPSVSYLPPPAVVAGVVIGRSLAERGAVAGFLLAVILLVGIWIRRKFGWIHTWFRNQRHELLKPAPPPPPPESPARRPVPTEPRLTPQDPDADAGK